MWPHIYLKLKHPDQGLRSLLLQQIQFDENFSMLNIQRGAIRNVAGQPDTMVNGLTNLVLNPFANFWDKLNFVIGAKLVDLHGHGFLALSVESRSCLYSYWSQPFGYSVMTWASNKAMSDTRPLLNCLSVLDVYETLPSPFFGIEMLKADFTTSVQIFCEGTTLDPGAKLCFLSLQATK
jgi:hypothetical protein